MSKGDQDARVLQDATGARYIVCLTRVRNLRLGLMLDSIDTFMARVAKLPKLKDGQERCVRCLDDLDGCACNNLGQRQP